MAASVTADSAMLLAVALDTLRAETAVSPTATGARSAAIAISRACVTAIGDGATMVAAAAAGVPVGAGVAAVDETACAAAAIGAVECFDELLLSSGLGGMIPAGSMVLRLTPPLKDSHACCVGNRWRMQ